MRFVLMLGDGRYYSKAQPFSWTSKKDDIYVFSTKSGAQRVRRTMIQRFRMGYSHPPKVCMYVRNTSSKAVATDGKVSV